MSTDSIPSWRRPSVTAGVIVYLGYLAVFFTTWIVNGVDYNRIGENAQTTKLWYALPTLFGCTFLVIAISVLGWWRRVMIDESKTGPGWIWVLPAAVAGIIVWNFLTLRTENLSSELLGWSLLGAVGVGFGEEMITRGSLVTGLRSRFSENKVWLISTLLFSALHVPNACFGLPLEAMPVQVVLTFIMGSGFYIMRRMSGTLLLPMILHGLWDSSIFLHEATQSPQSHLQFAVYPLAIVCVVAVVLRTRRAGVRD